MLAHVSDAMLHPHALYPHRPGDLTTPAFVVVKVTTSN